MTQPTSEQVRILISDLSDWANNREAAGFDADTLRRTMAMLRNYMRLLQRPENYKRSHDD